MDGLFSIAISGLQKAETAFSTAAMGVAEAPVEPTDMAGAFVEMVQAKAQYEFSAEVVKISSDMMDTLLAIQG